MTQIWVMIGVSVLIMFIQTVLCVKELLKAEKTEKDLRSQLGLADAKHTALQDKFIQSGQNCKDLKILYDTALTVGNGYFTDCGRLERLNEALSGTVKSLMLQLDEADKFVAFQSTFDKWLADKVEKGEGAQIEFNELYQSYSKWILSTGNIWTNQILTELDFAYALRLQGISKHKVKVNGKCVTMYQGVKWRGDSE